MGDGDDGGRHVPRQAHERADHNQDGHPEQVQVIACPFLTDSREYFRIKAVIILKTFNFNEHKLDTNLEFVLFPVDDHSRDLLIHEDEDGDKQSGERSSQVHPPGVASERRNKPASQWIGGLEDRTTRRLLKKESHTDT